MTKIIHMKRVNIILILSLLSNMLAVSVCFQSSQSELPAKTSESWKLDSNQLRKYQAVTSLKILSMVTEKDDEACTYDSCQEILGEISTRYQKMADSLGMTVYFSFECCDDLGHWTVLELAAMPFVVDVLTEELAVSCRPGTSDEEKKLKKWNASEFSDTYIQTTEYLKF